MSFSFFRLKILKNNSKNKQEKVRPLTPRTDKAIKKYVINLNLGKK